MSTAVPAPALPPAVPSTAAPVAAPVLFRDLRTACGRRFGIATLNAPASLNAISLAMVEALGPQLDAWFDDPSIVGIVLDGAGERAFCAGGDLRDLYRSIGEHGAGPNPYAGRFFELEYRLDHRIHTSPKPILCWGHGIVMGGGIGLMAGASHRVVTGRTRLAMPEIAIGLFPDVGGTWFLDRMPGRCGLFLALTGAPMNAADALFAGLADHRLPDTARGAVLDRIASTRWAAEPDLGTRDAARGPGGTNHDRLSHLLEAAADVEPPVPSNLRLNFDAIATLIGHDGLAGIAARLATLRPDDSWLAQAAAGFLKGSPTSAALAVALARRGRRRSLADVFRMEYDVALGCCASHDFPEGIRALLIDKDRQPHWQPARLADVDAALLDRHFKPRHDGAHPLADLGD